jgi:hypothetical protein
MHFPSVFVSHGAPSLLLELEQPAHQFLQGLGADLGRRGRKNANNKTARRTMNSMARPTAHDQIIRSGQIKARLVLGQARLLEQFRPQF